MGARPACKSAAATYEFSPGETLRTPTFYLMWLAYALGCSAGLMVISQLVPFARSVGIASTAGHHGLVVGAAATLPAVFCRAGCRITWAASTCCA